MSSHSAPFIPVVIAHDAPLPPTPEGQQSLAQMQCAPLRTGTRLTWPAVDVESELVIGHGYDLRDPCRIRFADPRSGWQHELDAGHASIGQRFHVRVPASVSELHVTMLDETPAFWLLADENRLPNSLPAVWPIDPGADRLARFFDRLERDGVAEFGWMGGCITEAYDALEAASMGATHSAPSPFQGEGRGEGETRRHADALSPTRSPNLPGLFPTRERGAGEPHASDAASRPGRWAQARERWLAHFLDDEHLRYQDLRGCPQVDAFVIIEATLPIASIVRTRPRHPVIDVTIDYLLTSAGRDATCEGCYTVAYPVLEIAKQRDRADLVDMAFDELLNRREKLFVDGDIYLRYNGGNRTYRNWARGVAWYILGHAKCLQLTGCDGRWAPIAEHLAERCRWAMGYQRDDGLWDNFFAEPGSPADTSGSCGIATALVHAAGLGLIDPKAATQAAARCWAGVQQHLHIDGWLGGVAPSNKRGEEAQHGHRRTSETFGQGLMGQLAAAVGG